MKERKDYETKAEILIKQFKAKIYELEAKTLEAKLNAKTGLDDLEQKLQSLKKQREKLDQKFDELKNASQEQWDSTATDFEDFMENVNANKQGFSEKAELWIDDLTLKINELEEKAKHAGEDLKVKLHEQIEHVKSYKTSLEKKLTELKEAQDDNWHKIKDGFEDNLSTLKKSINKAFEYIKK